MSDIVLTGHEHDGTRRTQTSGSGERNQYIEAAALQESDDPHASGFNVLVVDLASQRQKFTFFTWNGERYIPGTRDATWEEFQVNRLRQRGLFEPNQRTNAFLEEPGVELIHRKHGRLRLSDIFVFPDLRRIDFRDDDTQRRTIVRGGHIVDLVMNSPVLLITGDDQSGKTSLAKRLYSNFHEGGFVPLYIDAAQVKLPGDDRLYSRLSHLFGEQYEAALRDAYEQLDRTRRVIIIDNYHRLKTDGSNRGKLLERLVRFAGHVILLAHDITFEVEEITDPNYEFEHEQYQILPFGRFLRNELVERWLLLDGDDASHEAAEIARRIEEAHRTLNTLFGKNFVPAYPVFILAVMQASESATSVDIRASTHGYFYELFIRAALARGRTSTEYDVLTGYLAFLAFSVYEDGELEFDDNTFAQIHAEYERIYDVTRSYARMKDDLLSHQVLEQVGEGYRFKYKYIYYYFVASYIRDNITAEDVGKVSRIQNHVRKMAARLHDEENANILLFLAHLSKHPFIVRALREAAEQHFPSLEPARLQDDIRFIEEWGTIAKTIRYEDRDPREYRRQMLKAVDELLDSVEGKAPLPENLPVPDRDVDTEVRQEIEKLFEFMNAVTGALASLNILGQLLKNFPGSLEGQTKSDLARTCELLGLRVLSALFLLIRGNEQELVHELTRALREDNPDVGMHELSEQAKRSVVSLVEYIVYGVVRRITLAMGSPELTATYKRVEEQDDSYAHDLVHASLALDYQQSLPQRKLSDMAKKFEKNYISLSVLRHLVVQHFYLFPVDFRTKQRVCKQLGIAYEPLQRIDPSRRLLSGRS